MWVECVSVILLATWDLSGIHNKQFNINIYI